MKIRIHHNNDELQSLTIPMGGVLLRNQPDPAQVRKGLTRVYDFKRDGEGALVAEVGHEADLKRFLSLIEGFSPHGDESTIEAREVWGWTGERPEEDSEVQLASGQPEIVDEFIEDDYEAPRIDNDDDDDEPSLGLQIGLPDIPGKEADGDVWMAYGRSLPGVRNPKDHTQLMQYAATNYGVELKSTATLKILKEIASLQAAA